MTRKTGVIDAMEKRIAEILVDQVRDDFLGSCGKQPEPDSNPDGEFNWDDIPCVAAEMRQVSVEPEWDAQSRAALTSYSTRLESALKARRTSRSIDVRLTLAALNAAIERRNPPPRRPILCLEANGGRRPGDR
jgi:hypothetical protein